MSLHCHPGFTVVARYLNGEGLKLFCYLKARMMMDAGKQPSTNEGVELRRGVSPGNIDSFSILAMLFPLHSDAVSRIFRRETERSGQRSWADLFQANEADACYSHAMDAVLAEMGQVRVFAESRDRHGNSRGDADQWCLRV